MLAFSKSIGASSSFRRSPPLSIEPSRGRGRPRREGRYAMSIEPQRAHMTTFDWLRLSRVFEWRQPAPSPWLVTAVPPHRKMETSLDDIAPAALGWWQLQLTVLAKRSRWSEVFCVLCRSSKLGQGIRGIQTRCIFLRQDRHL